MARSETPASFHFTTEQMLILTLKLAQYSRVDLDKTSPHDAVRYYTTPMRANPTCHCKGSVYYHTFQLLFYPLLK